MEDVLHRRALADDAVEAEAIAGAARAARRSPARRRRCVDAGASARAASCASWNGLIRKSIAPRLIAVTASFDAAEAGDHDARGCRDSGRAPRRGRPCRRRRAAADRRPARRTRSLEAARSRPRPSAPGRRPKPSASQRFGDELPQVGFIFDDEDGRAAVDVWRHTAELVSSAAATPIRQSWSWPRADSSWSRAHFRSSDSQPMADAHGCRQRRAQGVRGAGRGRRTGRAGTAHRVLPRAAVSTVTRAATGRAAIGAAPTQPAAIRAGRDRSAAARVSTASRCCSAARRRIRRATSSSSPATRRSTRRSGGAPRRLRLSDQAVLARTDRRDAARDRGPRWRSRRKTGSCCSGSSARDAKRAHADRTTVSTRSRAGLGASRRYAARPHSRELTRRRPTRSPAARESALRDVERVGPADVRYASPRAASTSA